MLLYINRQWAADTINHWILADGKRLLLMT